MRRLRLHSPAFVAFVVALALLAPAPALAHTPDPTMGGSLWNQDARVTYRWLSGHVPPSWLAGEVNAAAADANASRGSRAATFGYGSGAGSTIRYGEPTGCGPNGIACFNRGGAPYSFTMAFRRHGYPFDWGILRWCQAYTSPPDGCFDVETVALDEFGHAEILGHHDNYSNHSDYLDAVVQSYSRTKPRAGYSVHRFGRCDVATLQRTYDVPTTTTHYSTCLDLSTALTLSASASGVDYRGPVTLMATLRVATSSGYGRLSSNLLSQRSVTLQRRALGSSTWASLAVMPASVSAGRYVLTHHPTASYDYRAIFWAPGDEGLNGSVSGNARVTVGPCRYGCPSVAH